MTASPAQLPAGFAVEMDQDTRQLSDGSLFGGSPARLLRLTPAGHQALAELREGPVRSAAAAVLARRLTDAGLAHPRPPADASRQPLSVTVIIPVRDRAAMLDRCLSAVGQSYSVVVVDDGSADPGTIKSIAASHCAELRRHDSCAGPAAARNTGLAGVSTDLVAFLDSDCVPPADWIENLALHLADPLVAAVAPRIFPTSGSTSAGCYEQAAGSLDLGDRPARVVPATRVAYVPTAALLVRRGAFDAVTRTRQVFDPDLRYGEDVDLVWRLHEAAWRIRYEPAVQVRHEVPADWPALLCRRFRYGTSAAPLARRHPENMAPLVLQPWPTVTALAMLARKPAIAATGLAATWLDLATTVRRAGVPADGAVPASITSARQTWLGIGRFATQFAAPVLALELVKPGGATRAQRWGRRAAAASLLLGPPLTAHAQRKPEMNPAAFTLAHVADDVCYGAGVWAGCLRERTARPLRPAISWRPIPISRPQATGKDQD
ncbi:MAG TPA: mycofactocin biosynthesis glycosyltransferase MftF [Streptosporangiaceae bacterium]|nr:mycofactocin biosynthesis glycosyltransferase MftF [Streptosporangiaceae bacterium]